MHLRFPACRASGLLLLLLGLGACQSPLYDQPGQVRETGLFVPPLYTSEISPDGTSWSWSGLFWLLGADAEGPRSSSRALPFWWQQSQEPWSRSTLLFPLYFSRTTTAETWRFYSLLYGSVDGTAWSKHYVLGPVVRWGAAKHSDDAELSTLFLFDWKRRADLEHFTLAPLLGLAHVADMHFGYPADGVLVGDHGRQSSRRFELVNVLDLVSLFGWDDVGDRRDVRVLSLFGNEVSSLFRSWRSRDPDNPFHQTHLFPLYLDRADASGATTIVGPLWGRFRDEAEDRTTDWWLLGLLSRTRQVDSTAWKVLGLTVAGA